MSDFTIASILSDKSNLGTPKNSSPKLPWLPLSPSVTPRPQQANHPWSPISSCWLSHSGPTPKPAGELITTPPSTRRQWTGSTPLGPRYSPYVRQFQLSRPSSNGSNGTTWRRGAWSHQQKGTGHKSVDALHTYEIKGQPVHRIFQVSSILYEATVVLEDTENIQCH